MQVQDFLKDFESQFDDVPAGTLNLQTELESIDEWGSLQALTIIAMIDSNYKVKVSGDEINNAKTVGEIYELVKNRQS